MIKRYSFLIIAFVGLISCTKDDDPVIINEEEVITTVNLIFTDKSDNSVQTFTWEKDGDKDDIAITNDKTYNVKVQFLNRSNPNNVENITDEVIEEKDDHFVFYAPTVKGLSIAAATDDILDSNNIGINISSDWTFTKSSNGEIILYLIHKPISKKGVVRDEFGGDTDVQVGFKVVIK